MIAAIAGALLFVVGLVLVVLSGIRDSDWIFIVALCAVVGSGVLFSLWASGVIQ